MIPLQFELKNFHIKSVTEIKSRCLSGSVLPLSSPSPGKACSKAGAERCSSFFIESCVFCFELSKMVIDAVR